MTIEQIQPIDQAVVPQREHIVNYRTMPAFVGPTVLTVCLAGALFFVFSPVSLVALFLPTGIAGLNLIAYIAIETFLRVSGALLLLFISYLVFEISRHDQLKISDVGMTFPISLGPGLLFRRQRNWDDIANILLGAMVLEDPKDTSNVYECELEEARDKKKMFIYFKSGGHATLELSRMPRASTERLFQAIESWCITCNRVPQNEPLFRDKDDRDRYELLSMSDKLRYTQIWEEELHSHFSATNFVPLDKGDTLQDGKFSVVMQLASGGLSAVYLAETFEKKLVVIKEAVLPAHLSDEARLKAKEMFLREAEVLRSLSHRFIAKIFDNFVERGRDYLVIEFIAGESLRQVVRKYGAQSEQTALDYMLKSARILDYLHDQEPPILHRDITPDNLMLRDDGEIILIDFGAANTYLGTATGTLVGKQAYIAPEQFRGKAVPASDIYSLGATVFFLLTGQEPEALSQSSVKEIRAEISEAVEEIVASCTALSVSERVVSADALIDRLEAILPDTILSLSSGKEESS